VAPAFDANGNQLKTVNALGDSTRSEYNNFNKVSRQVDARGNATRFEYDLFGQLEKPSPRIPHSHLKGMMVRGMWTRP
jgi:YD repeat-containing protein